MGMRRASEHREDRYSSSLHVVTEQDATSVGDTKSHVVGMQKVKGSFMDSEQTQRTVVRNKEHIERVRRMRREAIHRRQIVVATLAILTLVVMVAGWIAHFSMFYAAIPAVLLCVVIALGVRASRSAREWERHLSRTGAHVHTQEHAQQTVHESTKRTAVARDSSQLVNSSKSTNSKSPTISDRPSPQPAATDVLNQAEIQRILQLAKQEQQRAIVQQEHTTAAQVQHDGVKTQASADTAEKPVLESSPKAALAHVDMPKLEQDSEQQAASQDLISFSLGTVRNAAAEDDNGPESLEIKSSRQVSVAVPRPVKDDTREISVAGVVGTIAAQSTHSKDAHDNVAQATPSGDTDNQTVDGADKSDRATDTDSLANDEHHSFHDAEVHAKVEPPEQSSESLSIGLEAILSRRNTN